MTKQTRYSPFFQELLSNTSFGRARTRSSGGTKLSGIHSHTLVETNYPSGATTTTSGYWLTGYTYCPLFKTTDDYVTSRYRERVAAGERFNKPYSSREGFADVTQTYSGIALTQTSTNYKAVFSAVGYILRPSEFPTDMPANADYSYELAVDSTDAVNDAFSNAHQQQAMLVVDALEIKSTLLMVSKLSIDLASSMHGLWQDVARLNPGRNTLVAFTRRFRNRAADHLLTGDHIVNDAISVTKVANAQLTLNYGILPLISSIMGVLNTFNERGGTPQWQTYRGFRSGSSESTAVKTSSRPDGSIRYRWTKVVTVNWGCRATVCTRYRPSRIAALGLSKAQIFTNAHEAIRFSFVFDWFMNVGSFLSAVTPVPGGLDEESSLTTKTHTKIEWIFEVLAGSTISGSVTSVDTYRKTIFTEAFIDVQRSVNVKPSFPGWNLQFKSLNHLASGTALLITAAASAVLGRRTDPNNARMRN